MKIEINKSNRLFKSFKFACSAMPKMSSRYALNRICVIDDEITTTDEQRLHNAKVDKEVLKLNNIDDGLYEIIKNNKTEIHLLKTDVLSTKNTYGYTFLSLSNNCNTSFFPRYDSIIEYHEDFFEPKQTGADAFLPILSGLFQKQIALNPDFVTTTIFYMDKIKVQFKPGRNVLITSNNLTAVIMPVNCETITFQTTKELQLV